MNKFYLIPSLIFLSCSLALSQPSADKLPWVQHGSLRVSDDNHFLVHADGTPFFWLGETSWALHQNISREDVNKYLDNTKAAGYNVIQKKP